MQRKLGEMLVINPIGQQPCLYCVEASRLNTRGVPIMLENSPIILSSTSQNLYLLFFTIPPIIPKLFWLNNAQRYS